MSDGATMSQNDDVAAEIGTVPDIGIDGAAETVQEAAAHVVPEEDEAYSCTPAGRASGRPGLIRVFPCSPARWRTGTSRRRGQLAPRDREDPGGAAARVSSRDRRMDPRAPVTGEHGRHRVGTPPARVRRARS